MPLNMSPIHLTTEMIGALDHDTKVPILAIIARSRNWNQKSALVQFDYPTKTDQIGIRMIKHYHGAHQSPIFLGTMYIHRTIYITK